MTEDLIVNEIEKNKEVYINFLRELIQTDSYNPPGNEKNVAIKIQDYLNSSGIKSEIFPFGENRANLIAYLNDNFHGKNLLYNGHMDVVPPGSEEEWKYSPLSAFVKKNKYLFGRGATDMKSGLAAMVIALKILKDLNINVSGNLILNAVADEETGGNFGTKWCLENKLTHFKIDFTVIGEPTGLDPLPKSIMLGEKGRVVVKLVTHGISTHASWPFMGKNAIYMMSEIIEKLEKLGEYIPSIKPPFSINQLKKLLSNAFPNEEVFEKILAEQPMLQSILKALTNFTISLTVIHGGIKDNVIPDKCEAFIDMRLLPGQKVESIINGLKRLIKEDLGYEIANDSKTKSNDISVGIELIQQSEGSFWKDWENDATLEALKNIIEEIYKKKSFYLIYPASQDAQFIRNGGYCPATISFGPGSGSSAHAANEFVEIKDFLNSIKVYALFAYKFIK